MDRPCRATQHAEADQPPPGPVRAHELARQGLRRGLGRLLGSFKHEMWRFQIPAQVIAKPIPSFVEYPPMQAGASFSVGDLKEKIEVAMKAAQQSIGDD